MDNGQVVAIKVIQMDKDRDCIRNIQNEVVTMRLCQHSNILPCFSCFSDETDLWIVMPFIVKGSLLGILQHLRSNDRIRPGEGFEVDALNANEFTCRKRSSPTLFVKLPSDCSISPIPGLYIGISYLYWIIHF